MNNYKVADKLRSTNWAREGGSEKLYGTTAEMVFRLLTVPMDYLTFATTKVWSTPKDTRRSATKQEEKPESKSQSVDKDLNLEFIHNYVHGCAGGDGHMGNVPVAAFDPLFWLHHWQVLILLFSSIAIFDHWTYD